MTDAPPRIYSIPAGTAFVDALAEGLYDWAGGDPLTLAGMTVLLPQRRAVRALQEAFLRLSDGRALLLPRLVPVGDVDVDELLLGDAAATEGGLDSAATTVPEAMPALRRQLLLTRLVAHWGARDPAQATPSVDHAARLAAELARLVDQVETEGLDFAGLADLVPDRYAQHWQQTLDFLKIVTETWPAIEAEEGRIGPAARRRRLMQAQAEAWRATPPTGPVIAAGSTGSIPTTADLLAVVARLPHGAVVLPGLDRAADAETWAAIQDDPTHPQHTMARLLDRLGVARESVADWPSAPETARRGGAPIGGVSRPAPPARAEVLTLALRPASATPDWRGAIPAETLDRLRLGLIGVQRVECPGPAEEAETIALLLRQALEVPGKTAALVTPDRNLARRVAAALARWDLAVDDSAGTPLHNTVPGTFLRLTAAMLAEDLAPLALLAGLKHPLAAGGETPGAFRRKVRLLERQVLRGPRPPAGFDGLLAAVDASPAARTLRPWLTGLRDLADDALAALADAEADFAALFGAQMRFAEALAADDRTPGAARLWAGEAGEALAGFAAEALQAADAAPPVAARRYPQLLESLMAGRVVRPRFGGHPRLAIWGPMEARLQHRDLMILGGLNEGTWPAETAPGPWLSRPMRTEFGLPAVEQRIGLMAHDFAQVFAAPEVLLTRATRVEGTPTVPSRWLLRLDAVLAVLGVPGLRVGAAAPLAWAAALDRPAETRPEQPPAPTPPLAARPRKLPVTAVETWMRDPYALYARRILGLEALDPIDQDPGAAEHGQIIHAALEAFARRYPAELPGDPAAALLDCGRQAFGAAAVPPGLRAYWWPRFERIAAWLAETERARRADGRRVVAEGRGRLDLDAPGGPFTLTAKADRIEIGPDGALHLIDYKTGTVPQPRDVALGFAPQLPLEAAIASDPDGGFEGVAPAPVAALAYWRLTGGPEAGEIKPLTHAPADLAAEARAGLAALLAAFDDPATPYRAVPRPSFAPRYSDTEHLARTQAWSTGDESAE